MKTIIVNADDMRSVADTSDGLVWTNQLVVNVPDNFSPGGKTYNPETKEWITDPPYIRTEQDDINDITSNRDALVNEARSVIHDWTIELGLGSISDEDKESLAAWMAYIKKLNTMKLEGSPDSVEWPDKPQ